MHLLIIINAPYETEGMIAPWAHLRGHRLSYYRPYESPSPTAPDITNVDMIVVMGGPMNVDDTDSYPWLALERELIRQAIQAGKHVLGICLGAQLIASVLGARVYAMDKPEIGWFDITTHKKAAHHPLLEGFPSSLRVFHWHGDMFDLPENTTLLMSSKHCNHQAFLYNNHVLALQFHLEMDEKDVSELIKHSKEQLFIESPSVQNKAMIEHGLEHTPTCRKLLFDLLDRFTGSVPSGH